MTAEPVPPFWFRQRQCRLEPLEYGVYRLTGPNLAEAFISIRSTTDGRWAPVFRLSKDGPNPAESLPPSETAREAWEAAFELYRTQVVV